VASHTVVIIEDEGNLALALTTSPEQLILNVMLPGMSGYDICKKVWSEPDVPILMLAAAAPGLGTRLTTNWQHKGAEVLEMLGILDSVEIMAMIPRGCPEGGDHVSGGARKPVDDVTPFGRWLFCVSVSRLKLMVD
jgi:chemotaxis response regulator CheB